MVVDLKQNNGTNSKIGDLLSRIKSKLFEISREETQLESGLEKKVDDAKAKKVLSDILK